MFAVQDEITRAITAALIPKLSGHSPALVKPYTGSVDAYELCLRARYQHQKRTPAGLAEALRLFEQAAARDPDCALAYAGLAHVCLLLCYFGGLETRDGMPRMRAAAARALELDDTLPVTHVRMADALCFGDWDWAGAEREYLRALELDSDSTETLCRYSLFLWAKQRHDEALVMLRKALELDPFSLDANWFIGWVYLSLRRLDEAEEVAHRMVRLDPNSWIGYQLIAWTESVRGRWPDALAAYERSAAIEGGPASLSVLCWCNEKSGRPIDARRTLERLELLTRTRRPAHVVGPCLRWRRGRRAGARLHDAGARGATHTSGPLRSFIAVTGWLSPYRGLLEQHGL